MRYFLIVTLLFTLSSCGIYKGLSEWGDRNLPNSDDWFGGGTKVVYQKQPAGNKSYEQQTYAPQQPQYDNPYATQQYQNPYATPQYQQQTYQNPAYGYVPPVNNLPPVDDNSGEYRSMFDQSNVYGGGDSGWTDPMIPEPPIGYQ